MLNESRTTNRFELETFADMAAFVGYPATAGRQVFDGESPSGGSYRFRRSAGLLCWRAYFAVGCVSSLLGVAGVSATLMIRISDPSR